MKFSIRTIPAAAAMTAAILFGAQVHAQTATPPTTAAGDKAAMPAGPNTDPKTAAERDAGKPMGNQGMGNKGMGMGAAGSNMPAGSGNMGNQGSMSGPMGSGDAEQPVRQSGKVAKNKAERMEKGNKPKSSMNKSNEPVRESDLKDAPAK